MSSDSAVPAGFEPLSTTSPFNNHAGPYFVKAAGGQLVFGLRVDNKHCNRSGSLHGAMICAIADVAIGNSIGMTIDEAREPDAAEERRLAGDPARVPMATVSMTTDFVGTARLGDWIEVQVDVQRAGRTLAFANAYVMKEDERIARASAVFRLFGS